MNYCKDCKYFKHANTLLVYSGAMAQSGTCSIRDLNISYDSNNMISYTHPYTASLLSCSKFEQKVSQ